MLKQFPPYGVFADHYADTVEPTNLAPFKWISGSKNREADYDAWKTDVLGQISQTLWPLWSRETSQWINPNHSHMLALTQADFALMDKLNAQNSLDRKPSVPSPASNIQSHHDFFKEEDEKHMGKSYAAYHSGFDETDTRHKQKALDTMRSFFGSVSIQFKTEIQRPRAYQISLMMGRSFKMKLAKSAVTSSMSSGHCFQGLLFGCVIYDRWLSSNKRATTQELEALQQYAVDIGDRRVFAGVHYPSDNLASWLMTLKIIPKIFENPLVGEFAVRAIAERSLVWNCIKESKAKPYKAAIKNLENTIIETLQAGYSWEPFNSKTKAV